LDANGQVASATDTGQSAYPSADFQEFQAFKQHQRQQQQQRHQQQQQQQAEECAQIASDFNRWDINDTCNAITEVVMNACNLTPPPFLHVKPFGKTTFQNAGPC
jgi:hypothetical protein